MIFPFCFYQIIIKRKFVGNRQIKEVNDFNFETEVHATLLKKETLAPVFYCEFCNIFKNTFFTEQLRVTASNCIEK